MQSGISPSCFWEYTLDEIVDIIDAFFKNKRYDQKFEILSKEVLSMQIFERIAALFNKNNADKIRKIWDYYPSIFEEEKNNHETSLVSESQWDAFKDRRRHFAEVHNKKQGGDTI